MHIAIVNTGIIPVTKYGGTQRVVYYLGKELVKLGHKVTYLVYEGSSCDFANVLVLDKEKPVVEQLPEDVDLIHCHNIHLQINTTDKQKPYVITLHGNIDFEDELDENYIFVSKNHASRYGSESFVYNGMDWEDYGAPNLDKPKNHFHFLGNAAWRVKNVQGAIDIVNKAKSGHLRVLGGKRLNLRMGFRFTASPRVRFYGMVGGENKFSIMRHSKGLIFPVRWNEPFGLSITESLFYGAPVFGTPYGSLPELVNNEVGFLSSKSNELIDAVKQSDSYNRKTCHEYARDNFNSRKMALDYIKKYEKVLNGEKLNKTKPKLIKKQTERFLPWE